MTIWYILRSFCAHFALILAHFVHFFPFWYHAQKNLATLIISIRFALKRFLFFFFCRFGFFVSMTKHRKTEDLQAVCSGFNLSSFFVLKDFLKHLFVSSTNNDNAYSTAMYRFLKDLSPWRDSTPGFSVL
jgi:hypothetical protein